MTCAAGMAELSERLCLDLSDSFTCNSEFLTYFLESTASSVVESEAELDNVLFSGGEGAELSFDHLAAHCC